MLRFVLQYLVPIPLTRQLKRPCLFNAICLLHFSAGGVRIVRIISLQLYAVLLWSTYHMIFNTGQAFLNTKWFVFWIRKHVITESNGWDVIYLSSNFPTGNCLALMVDQTEGVGKIKISCFVRQVWVITEVERNCRLSSFQFLSQITQTHQKIHS